MRGLLLRAAGVGQWQCIVGVGEGRGAVTGWLRADTGLCDADSS